MSKLKNIKIITFKNIILPLLITIVIQKYYNNTIIITILSKNKKRKKNQYNMYKKIYKKC
jgi:hypothetical protein